MPDSIPNVPLDATMTDVMTGAYLLGGMSMSTLPDFLSGKMDRIMGIFVFHQIHHRLPEFETDLQDQEVIHRMDRLKDYFRSPLQEAFNRLGSREPEQSKQPKHKVAPAARNKFHDLHAMSKPAPEGTVDELAKKYGVSKSQVRLLKRENRLHELTSQDA